MSLRKIKDLIREMIFENQTAEHEYAAVMANLVLDVNQESEYEKTLSQIKARNDAYDKYIEARNQEIKAIKEQIDSVKKAKPSMDMDLFKETMRKLNEQKKHLEEDRDLKIQQKLSQGSLEDDTDDLTKRDKINIGFPLLDSRIKKYACLRYLANQCVRMSDFKTVTGEDGFIYADEDVFKSSEMAGNFREISDYVDYIFGARESKLENEESIAGIINADAESLGLPKQKLTAKTIIETYNKLLARIAKENSDKLTEKENIEQSQIGVEPIHDFGNGLVMYRLMPDTEYYEQHKKHRNLVYESDQMGICIGHVASYSDKILNLEKNQYYTLRERAPNGQLIPHCTIEVNGDVVNQVKGNSNRAVDMQYVQQVREFLNKDLNCAFPNEKNKDGKRRLYDYSNIGFVNDVNKNTVDVFNLPENVEFNVMPYDTLKVIRKEVKKIKSIKSIEIDQKSFTEEDRKIILSLKDINELEINVKNWKTQNFDFGSIVKKLTLSGGEKINEDFKVSKDVELIMRNIRFESKQVDFSNISSLALSEVSFEKGTDIKFNPNAKMIDLHDIKGLDFDGGIEFPNVETVRLSNIKLQGNLDFSYVSNLYMAGSDMSKIKSLKINPNAKVVNLIDTWGFRPDKMPDLSNVEGLNLGNTDWLSGDLDFSGVKYLNLASADLLDVKSVKFNPNAERIDLNYIKYGTELLKDLKLPNVKQLNLSRLYGLSGNLDFSNVDELDLSGANLSNVKSVKFNPNADYISFDYMTGLKLDHGLSLPNAKRVIANKVDWLSGDLDFSNALFVDVNGSDLSKVKSIKAQNIYLEHAKKDTFRGDLDFSGIVVANLRGSDFANIKSIKFGPKTKEINLAEVQHFSLNKISNTTNVDRINLKGLDLSNGKICGRYVELSEANLSGEIDATGAHILKAENVHITKAHIKINPASEGLRESRFVDDLNHEPPSHCFRNAFIKDSKFTANNLLLNQTVLSGDVDFSGVRNLKLMNYNLFNFKSMKFNKDAQSIIINGYDGTGTRSTTSIENTTFYGKNVELSNLKLSGDIDMTDVKDFKLKQVGVVDAHIKCNPKADIHFDYSSFDSRELWDSKITADRLSIGKQDEYWTAFRGNLDLSDVKHLRLNHVFQKSETGSIKFNPNAKSIEIQDLFMNPKDENKMPDFSNVEKLTLVSPIPTEWISENMDFGNAAEVSLKLDDLADIKKIKANKLVLSEIENKGKEDRLKKYYKLSGVIDFSNVKELHLDGVDVSQVTEMILPEKVFGLSKTDLIRFKFKNAVRKIANVNVADEIGKVADKIKSDIKSTINQISGDRE